MDSEQLFHDLEQRQLALRKELEAVTADRDALKQSILKWQSSNDEIRENLQSTEKKNTDLQLEIKIRDNQIRDLSLNYDEISDRYRRRSEECDRLREDLNNQSTQLIEYQNRIREQSLTLTEQQSQQLPNQIEHVKLLHEKEVLKEKVSYLENQLSLKVKEEREFKNDLNTKIHEKDSLLRDVTLDNEDLKRQISSLKDQLSSQGEKVDTYINKLRDSDSSLVTMQGSYAQEIAGLKRLSDLNKRYFEEATTRVEELESNLAILRESSNSKVAKYKEHITSQAEDFEKRLESNNKEWQEKILELEKQLAENNQNNNNNKVVSIAIEDGGNNSELVSTMTSIRNFDEIGITQMLDKLVQVERELQQEKNKRVEADIYLKQILKDVESKAPIIASQRRDYNRIVESHSQLKVNLDKVIVENSELRSSVRVLQDQADQYANDTLILEQHNADLSQQLQHLLKKQLDSSVSSSNKLTAGDKQINTATGVVSEYLVRYDDVAEMQTRNAQLLQIVRKLSLEQEKFSQQVQRSDTSELSSALKAALLELEEMRSARKLTEDMVVSLAQQRDMYRAMVEDSEGSASTAKLISNSAIATLSGALSPSSPLGENNNRNSNELKFKISQLEDEKRRMQERVTRLEEGDKLMNESLDKFRNESTAIRMECAQAASESRFHKERAERLENSLKTLQEENSSSLSRRMDMERTLLDLQRELRNKENKLSELSDQLRVSHDQQRRAEVDKEVAQQSETRISSQLSEARDEIKRHSLLIDHLHRIESGLKSRAEEEREAIIQERDALSKSYSSLRKQMDEKSLIEDQKLKSLEDELRSLRSRLEQRTSENIALNENLIREQITGKAAHERGSLLEKQLNIAQDRLMSLQGSQIVESLFANDVATKDLEIERQSAEIQSLKQQLTTSEEHQQQFRNISAATEATLKELRTKSVESKAALEEEVNRIRRDFESAQAELEQHRSSTLNLIQELEDSRERLRLSSLEHLEHVRVSQEELSLAKQETSQLQNQIDIIKAETIKFQNVATSTHANYERELQLHAKAERELIDTRKEMETVKETLASSQQQVVSISADMIRLEKNIADERTKHQSELSIVKDQLTELQRTNELLHSQVQSYGVQIERLQESKGSDLSGTASGEEKLEDSADTTAKLNELVDLRKSISEMREVLRYVKKEKDMLTAKLTVVETENSRFVHEISSLNKNLDEAKIELKRELDRNVVVRSEEDFNKLMDEVKQLYLFKESNAHFRGENVELAKKVKTLADEVISLKSLNSPLEDEVRKLKADKESLELINDQLVNDVGYWKDRLQKMVSRYNDVDPEEHRLLKVKLEEVSQSLSTLQETTADQTKASLEQVSQLQTELNQMKTLKDNETKQSDNLREKMRNTMSKVREQQTKITEITVALAKAQTEADENKSLSATLSAELDKAKEALAIANRPAPVVVVASSNNAVLASASPVVTVSGGGESDQTKTTTTAAATNLSRIPSTSAVAGLTKKRDRSTQETDVNNNNTATTETDSAAKQQQQQQTNTNPPTTTVEPAAAAAVVVVAKNPSQEAVALKQKPAQESLSLKQKLLQKQSQSNTTAAGDAVTAATVNNTNNTTKLPASKRVKPSTETTTTTETPIVATITTTTTTEKTVVEPVTTTTTGPFSSNSGSMSIQDEVNPAIEQTTTTTMSEEVQMQQDVEVTTTPADHMPEIVTAKVVSLTTATTTMPKSLLPALTEKKIVSSVLKPVGIGNPFMVSSSSTATTPATTTTANPVSLFQLGTPSIFNKNTTPQVVATPEPTSTSTLEEGEEAEEQPKNEAIVIPKAKTTTSLLTFGGGSRIFQTQGGLSGTTPTPTTTAATPSIFGSSLNASASSFMPNSTLTATTTTTPMTEFKVPPVASFGSSTTTTTNIFGSSFGQVPKMTQDPSPMQPTIRSLISGANTSLDDKKNQRALRFASNTNPVTTTTTTQNPVNEQSAEEEIQNTDLEVIADETSKMEENVEDEA